MSAPIRTLMAAGVATLLAGCSAADETDGEFVTVKSPQEAFFAALSTHCGKAYAGGLVSDDEVDADMQGARMVMHVRECDDQRIAIPFHIRAEGEEWNRSRTWLITRTADGLRLKHDHRHEDGESDAVTMYGGDTASEGTAGRQDFPVDAESIALFGREGLDASVTNVWRVEVDPADAPDAKFAYQLTRTEAGGAPEDRNFRVVFDLTSPVAPPPAPWGHEQLAP